MVEFLYVKIGNVAHLQDLKNVNPITYTFLPNLLLSKHAIFR